MKFHAGSGDTRYNDKSNLLNEWLLQSVFFSLEIGSFKKSYDVWLRECDGSKVLHVRFTLVYISMLFSL